MIASSILSTTILSPPFFIGLQILSSCRKDMKDDWAYPNIYSNTKLLLLQYN